MSETDSHRERVSVGEARPPCFFFFLREQDRRDYNLRIMFICFTFVYNVHVLYCDQCVRFELVKSPEVILCG